MDKRQIVLWVDLLAGSGEIDVPALISEHFDVRIVRNKEHLSEQVSRHDPVCIMYDCDYVDRKRLELISRIRHAHASTPFAVFLLEHSETLALWAFRRGAIDYFAKPAEAGELRNLVKRLEGIGKFRGSRREREAFGAAFEIPDVVTNTRSNPSSKLAPAVYYVQSHYNEKIYADAVARICDLSPAHFSKVFRQHFKMSFQEFLLRYRIAKACCLIGTRDATISDVCFSVGFRDPSYFTRMFRRYTGVSPSEYRNSDGISGGITDTLQGIDEPSISSSQVVRSLANEFA